MFVFSIQLIVGKSKNFRWLHSIRGALVLEATTLTTEPQRLPMAAFCNNWFCLSLFNTFSLYQRKTFSFAGNRTRAGFESAPPSTNLSHIRIVN